MAAQGRQLLVFELLLQALLLLLLDLLLLLLQLVKLLLEVVASPRGGAW